MFDKHQSRLLAAYVDGNLSAQDVRKVETHIGACARCRTELENTRFATDLLRQLPTVHAPEHVWAAIEASLAQLEPRKKPPLLAFRFAAAMMLVVVAIATSWYFLRPAAMQWEVIRLAGSPMIESVAVSETGRIGKGESIETDGSSRARIRVGDIGSVDVEPNTRLDVVATVPGDHRLALHRGEIRAKISAPPRLFLVETPSGTAVDLGCEYSLRCDTAGFGILRVGAGWVSFEWQGRESLVPAGAICRARPRLGPGTPYFEDASQALVDALAALDFDNGGRDALHIVLDESRKRDTLTLWHLLSRVDSRERMEVFERIAALTPPPDGISRDQALRLDPDTLKRWREELAWIW